MKIPLVLRYHCAMPLNLRDAIIKHMGGAATSASKPAMAMA